MALNGLVMRVNNLVERKNRREAIRDGKVIPSMDRTGTSQFSKKSKGKVKRIMKATPNSTATYKTPKNKQPNIDFMGGNRLEHTAMMDNEDLEVDVKENQARQELEELDLKYLIGDNEDEDMIFRGFSKPTQNK